MGVTVDRKYATWGAEAFGFTLIGLGLAAFIGWWMLPIVIGLAIVVGAAVSDTGT